MNKNKTSQKDSIQEITSQLKILQKVMKEVYSSYDLERIFAHIADEAVRTMGYTTALILTYNEKKDSHEIKTLATQKRLIPRLNKIIGFSLKDMCVSIKPDLNETVKEILDGQIVVRQRLSDVIYPVFSKRICSALQKLAHTKNYIVVPLNIEGELAGAIFISSPKETISDNELEVLKSFRHIVSHALSNASLLEKTKTMKESLEKEKAYLDQLLECSQEAVVTTDNYGNVVRVNPEFTRMFGFSRDEAVGRFIDDLLAPGEYYQEASSITKRVAEGSKYALETKRCRKDGKIIDVSLLAHPIRIGGRPAGSYAIYRDISDRKNAERELKESEMIHRALFTHANDAVFLMDLEGNHVNANKKAADMLGYEIDELMGKSFRDIVASSDLPDAQKRLEGLLKNKSYTLYERVFRKKDGTEFPVEINVSLIRDFHNKPRLIQSIVRDITERRKSEERIKTSLREKEVLLQEIHHRVKNNMQIVSSLINLQSSKMADEKTVKALQSSQNRIRSMAIIHEKLYQSKDFTNVDLSEYVKSLIRHLLNTYGVDKQKIQFHTDINDIYLDINKAIPCGLIINELLTNSIKHAFPNGKSGEIRVSIQNHRNQKKELSVSDNGKGIPEDMNMNRSRSLGLTLVKILAEEQLRGSLYLDKTKGTCFKIVF